MPIDESLVASVVAETSERMKDPAYVQLAVSHFVHAQPNLSQFVGSRAAKLGGGTSVVQLLFHAEILSECLRRGWSRELPIAEFSHLDLASKGDLMADFAAQEPALSNFVASNLDELPLRAELCRMGLALRIAGGL